MEALAPLMACVSKPMRMRDFPFQLADTLFQYSLLKQLSERGLDASSTAPPRHKNSPTPRRVSGVPGPPCPCPFLLLVRVCPHLYRRLSGAPLVSDAVGLQQQKIALHVLLPEAEDCERVDERQSERRGGRKQELGCKTQRHAIHTVTSGTRVHNHNPRAAAGSPSSNYYY